MSVRELLAPPDRFVNRHLGPRPHDIAAMLKVAGYDSLDDLVDVAVPADIRMRWPLEVGPGHTESEALADLRRLASENVVLRQLIGAGYHDCVTPTVILRNILESPGWYTQYTPYQAEIAQGRLEALLNFQTMVADLTALPLANASLLDEGTAAAEAMAMCWAIGRKKRSSFFVADDCHPQTIAVVRTRAERVGIEVDVGPVSEIELSGGHYFGLLVQYPTTDGRLVDHGPLAARAKEAGTLVVAAADLLALTLVKPPGEWGADVAIGSTQRFGVPLGFGGPHAAYLATHASYTRQVPGRIIGVSIDANGNPAYRLAVQTREQHIRRDRATSNICTAQVLLAIIAGAYAVYHGPDGLRAIARRVAAHTAVLAAGLRSLGVDIGDSPFFDTLRLHTPAATGASIVARAEEAGYNLRRFPAGDVGVSLDERTTLAEVAELLALIAGDVEAPNVNALVDAMDDVVPSTFARTSVFLEHPVFHEHRSEHQMLRYLQRLRSRDLSLTTSMIPLGSCTMKLNATTEMIPVTWPGFAGLHPFAPEDQWRGYARLFHRLEAWLAEITGFAAVSLQPNAGSQGEYAGLLTIRAYHEAAGQGQRQVCLIPVSAHGTNPASAVMADVCDIARGLRGPVFGQPAETLEQTTPASSQRPAPYYLRMALVDKPGALAKIATVLGEAGVSIYRMRQYEHSDTSAPVLIVTHKTSRNALVEALANMDKTGVLAGEPVALRIEEV